MLDTVMSQRSLSPYTGDDIVAGVTVAQQPKRCH